MPLLAVAFADYQLHLLGVYFHQPILTHLEPAAKVLGQEGHSSTVSVARTLHHL